jgi:hypothetical protein
MEVAPERGLHRVQTLQKNCPRKDNGVSNAEALMAGKRLLHGEVVPHPPFKRVTASNSLKNTGLRGRRW